jgi:hypothetical protein
VYERQDPEVDPDYRKHMMTPSLYRNCGLHKRNFFKNSGLRGESAYSPAEEGLQVKTFLSSGQFSVVRIVVSDYNSRLYLLRFSQAQKRPVAKTLLHFNPSFTSGIGFLV